MRITLRQVLWAFIFAFGVSAIVHCNQFTGRVTEVSGRGIRSIQLRVQSNFCGENPDYLPVYEYYGYTNTFGYFNIQAPSDCDSYSIRILGNGRYPAIEFFPQGYYYLYHTEDRADRILTGANFVFNGNP